jgi:hypothetical protein
LSDLFGEPNSDIHNHSYIQNRSPSLERLFDGGWLCCAKRFSRYWQLHRLYSFRQLWRRLVAAEAVATEAALAVALSTEVDFMAAASSPD